jgi:Leucine-rich repeat (LRR) protein
LKQLEELWLNENPLEALPVTLDQNRKLRVLDLRKTKLRRLPNELGRLKQIHTIDLKGTAIKPKQQGPYSEGGTAQLMAHLHMRDQRKQAKLKMLQRMREGVYRQLWDVPGGQDSIIALIKEVFLCFNDLEDIKNLIRNAERLFPDDIEDVDIHSIQEEFEALRRENLKKKLAAELELKIR